MPHQPTNEHLAADGQSATSPLETHSLEQSATSPLETHSLERLAVVLVSPRNTLNIGAVARAMSNFGAHDLRVANIFYKDFRSASSAVGPSAALLRQSREYATVPEAVHDAHLVVGTTGDPGRPFLQPLERLEAGGQRIRKALGAGQRVALLFGSEKFGLSNDDMSHCHLLLRIPTRDEHASMNLGQAAALCLYELARIGDSSAPAIVHDAPLPPWELPQNFPRVAEVKVPATAESVERLTTLLEQALVASEYPGMGSLTRGRQLRTMVRRLQASERDTGLATGFLRQILWKLRSSAPPPALDK